MQPLPAQRSRMRRGDGGDSDGVSDPVMVTMAADVASSEARYVTDCAVSGLRQTFPQQMTFTMRHSDSTTNINTANPHSPRNQHACPTRELELAEELATKKVLQRRPARAPAHER